MALQKTAIVTGGAGFLGSHLCKRLLDDGLNVISVDNYSTGDKNNIIPLLDNPHFEDLRHDISEPLHLEADYIYNLACPASPVHYQHDPIKTVQTNVFGVGNMLKMALESNARFFQASTSEVYGDPEQHPQTESYRGNVNPIGPRACYDEGKRCAETLCFDYHRGKGLEVKVVRIFNTYGPNMHPQDGRVVSNFIMQALKNDPITLYGDGSQTRSFCYVDDLIEGFIKMMHSPAEFTGPVNLGNPTEMSVRDLAEIIIDLTGSKSGILEKPLPEDDPVRRRPDISLAKTKLDWEPQHPLKDGLQKTIAYFEQLLKQHNL